MKESTAGVLKINGVFGLDKEYLISIKQKGAEETRTSIPKLEADLIQAITEAMKKNDIDTEVLNINLSIAVSSETEAELELTSMFAEEETEECDCEVCKLGRLLSDEDSDEDSSLIDELIADLLSEESENIPN